MSFDITECHFQGVPELCQSLCMRAERPAGSPSNRLMHQCIRMRAGIRLFNPFDEVDNRA
jgi:hypothetical protein